VSYRTALNWFHAGTPPVPARQLPTGTILVEPATVPRGRTVAYCAGCPRRISGGDLERQAGRVAEECGKRGITLDATVTEVGSGLNGHRVKLRELLADACVTRIVVEHRDRLARFGVEHLEAALAAIARSLVVLHADEVKDDLVREMIEVLTGMCARLYGGRGARRRADAAVRAAERAA
jgi:putative resolvase